jgi:hypothetical protein
MFSTTIILPGKTMFIVLKRLSHYLATPNLRNSYFLLTLSLVTLLTGCSIQQTNTYAQPNINFPLQTNGVLIVYEETYPPNASAHSLAPILGTFKESVLNVVKNDLKKIGLQTFTIIQAENGKGTVLHTPQSWYRINVSVIKDTQICNNVKRCVHNLTVGITMYPPNSRTSIWRTEIEEPLAINYSLDLVRYKNLAEHVSKAILMAVAPRGLTT